MLCYVMLCYVMLCYVMLVYKGSTDTLVASLIKPIKAIL